MIDPAIQPTFSPTIRPATADDAPAVAAIYNDAILRTTASFWTEPRPVEEVRADLLSGGSRYPFLVAQDLPVPTGHESVLGFARAKQWNPRPGYAGAVEVSIYIAEAARGLGVGRALYTDLFAQLRTLGYRHTIAVIAVPNPASVALHEAFGMRRVGTLEQIGEKLGQTLDVGFWQGALTRTE